MFDYVYWFLVLMLNGRIAIWLHMWFQHRREVRFLKHLKVKYPDSEIILSTIATSDMQALRQLKEQLDAR